LLNGIKCIFFDLDGTLLGVSDEDFFSIYSKRASKYFINKIPQERFLHALIEGTKYMMTHSDPESFVFESFFKKFKELTEIDEQEAIKSFEEFYLNDFKYLKSSCVSNPIVKSIITMAKQKNMRLVLATNPVFPKIATDYRLEWAGLSFDDFEFVSTAENFNYCKPNPSYYNELLSRTSISPDEVLMVGNDYLYDMSASKVGIKTWLVDEYEGNKEYEGKFHIDYRGSLDELHSELLKL